MRSRTGIFTLLAISLTIFLFVVSAQKANTVSRPSGVLKKSPVKLRSLLSTPVRKESAMAAGFSETCLNLEQRLFERNAADFGNSAKNETLPSAEGCTPANPKVAKMLKYYSLKCGANPGMKVENPEECSVAGLMLRSTLASIARGNPPLRDIQDINELADRLVASFGDFFTDMSPQGLQEVIDISDRMLELEPDTLPAVKAGAIGSMFRNILTKEAEGKGIALTEPPNWNDLEKRVAQLEEMNPSDPDLDTLHRIVETEGMNPERVKNDSLTRISKNPDDWHEHQILAWANWKTGRRDEAKSELQRAMKLKPDESELQKNWSAINRVDAKTEDFKISFRIGVGFTDLLK